MHVNVSIKDNGAAMSLTGGHSFYELYIALQQNV